MKFVGVIPARFGSTRFPGKPLELIANKALLEWVIEGARQSRKLTSLIVATDDERIAALARNRGLDVAMTASDLPTGTDRVWQAVRDREADVVINIQGDEPLIEGHILDSLIEPFESDPTLEMATLGRTLNEEALLSSNTAKIVLNAKSEALYFSRLPIPYSRFPANEDLSGALKHIGIYAFKKSFLEKFCAQEPTFLEKAESLEQLRALYLGARIRVVKVEHDSWGVDSPGDVQKIEKMLETRRLNRI